MSAMDLLTLRVRSQVGTWRVGKVAPLDNFKQIRERLAAEHNATLGKNCFAMDPAGSRRIPDECLVRDAGLKNGDMIYTLVEECKLGIHEASTSSKYITKDGKIVQQEAEVALKSTGFRPGMLPLRSMKMHWTLDEFVRMDEQFVYKVKAQEKSNCTLVSIESGALSNFQSYMRTLDFHSLRVGYLYGKFLDNNSVRAEVIYEPPQETSDVGFQLLDNPKADAVDAIATLLGLRKVGWVFAHPPREKGFFFSGPEVLFAAEQQLEAAQGVNDTPFATVKVTLDAEKGQAVVEAFQVSKQCMEMVAEGVVEVCPHLGHLGVSKTFTALVEGRNATEVDNNFFLATTPIEQFKSEALVSMFPRAHRIDNMQTRDDIKRQFKKEGKEGWSFVDLVGDFHLLLYLCEFLDINEDLPRICKAVVDRDAPLDEGYKLLLRSIAGIE